MDGTREDEKAKSRLSLSHCCEAVKLDVSKYQLFREEKEILQHAWSRVVAGGGLDKAETILVHGNDASAKSAFVQSLRRPVEQSQGTVLSGTFDAECCTQQHSPISNAIVDLFEKIEGEMGATHLREYIIGELGEEVRTLTRFLPRLDQLLKGRHVGINSAPMMSIRSTGSNGRHNLKQQSSSSIRWVSENSSSLKANACVSASLSRSLRNLLKALVPKSSPILFLVEDLHLASASALNLFTSLINDMDIKNILFVATYAEGDAKFKEAFFPDFHEANATLTDLHLGEMSVRDVNELVAAATDMPSTKTFELGRIVSKKTGGGFFLVVQFLELLQEQRLLLFSLKSNCWEWDIARIESETDVTESLADIIAKRIRQLPDESAQAILKISSCLGTQFDLDVVRLIIAHEEATKDNLQGDTHLKPIFGDASMKLPTECDASALQTNVDYLHQTGLLENSSLGLTKFSHEKVREASYALIPAGPERDHLHLRIGRLLYELNECGTFEEDWVFLCAVDQFNKVASCIVHQSDLLKVIDLNMLAAEIAMNMSAFVVAAAYLRAAVQLVERSGAVDYWKSQYRRCLRLHIDAAEMEQCAGNAENCLILVNTLCKHAHDLNDMRRAYFVQIHTIASQGLLQDAVVLGLDVLVKLGVSIPQKPRRWQIVGETQKTKKMLKGRTDESFLSGPKLTDRMQLMTLELLHLVSKYCLVLQVSDLLSIVVLRSLQYSLQYGVSEYTPCALANFGLILATSGTVDEGLRWSELAIRMVDSVSDRSKADVLFIIHAYLYHWKNPLRRSLDPLMKSYDIAMSTGSVEVALLSAGAYGMVYTCAGLPLSHVASDLRRYKQQSVEYNLDTVQTTMAPVLQFVLNLMGESRDVLELTGEAMNQETLLQHAITSGNRVAVRAIYRYRLLLATIFGHTQVALKIMESLPQEEIICSFGYAQEAFASALTCAAQARVRQRRKMLRQAQTHMNVLLKWTKAGNVNCHDMLLLLQAEIMGLASKPDIEKVRVAYDKAIASSCRSGYRHNAAIANEKAAHFLADKGDTFWFDHYLQKAHENYMEWKAWGKVRQLEMRYPILHTVDNDHDSVCSGSVQGRTRFTPLSKSMHDRISFQKRRSGSSSARRRSTSSTLERNTSSSLPTFARYSANSVAPDHNSEPLAGNGVRRGRSSQRSNSPMQRLCRNPGMEMIKSEGHLHQSPSASIVSGSDLMSSGTDDEIDIDSFH